MSYSSKIDAAFVIGARAAIAHCVNNGLLHWYTVSSNTSWANVEKAIIAGPFNTKKEADKECIDDSCWVEFLSPEEAKEITY